MLNGMVRGEFAIYPFVGGEEPPPYVQAAIEAINKAGLEVDLGPLGTSVTGPADEVLEALHRAQAAALEAGATSIVIRLEVEE
jgi:uncharacterized protein YqgV (UPF0045/DUF77 family)